LNRYFLSGDGKESTGVPAPLTYAAISATHQISIRKENFIDNTIDPAFKKNGETYTNIEQPIMSSADWEGVNSGFEK
jgi:hypothetical protein